MHDTRSTILEVAIRLFSEQGYNGVTMRAIADAVGISAPALYNHFADKKTLYETAVAEHFATQSAVLTPLLTATAPAAVRLRGFVERLCVLMHDDPDFRRLLQWELLNEDETRLRYLAEGVFAPLFRQLMSVLAEIRPATDSHLLAILVVGMIQKPFEVQPLTRFLPGSPTDPVDPGRVADAVMAVLEHGLEIESGGSVGAMSSKHRGEQE